MMQSDFAKEFTQEARTAALPAGPAWLSDERRAGLCRFRELGLPGPRLEEWKHTSLAELAAGGFAARPSVEIAPDELPGLSRLNLGGPRLVFVNGRYSPALSTATPAPSGLLLGSIAEQLSRSPQVLEAHLASRAAEDGAPFRALNAAYLEDGALLVVDDGVEIDRPVQFVYLATDGAAHPRTLIVAGRGSRLSVVESYLAVGDGRYFTNAVTDLRIGANAQVDHVRLQLESDRAFHVAVSESRQQRDSRYRVHNLQLGGRLVRHDLQSVLDGEGADCELNGLHLTRGRRHVDSHTILDHAKPHCTSHELYKGILAEDSRSVFKGRIIVRPDAQKTDAVQSNPNLLLSDGALAHSLPQLEIYADDVKCTHGATIGRLDEDAIFYLRSRGLREPEARKLLIGAFVGEVLERIEPPELRAALDPEVLARLPFGED